MVWLYCYHIIESCLLHLKQDFKTLVYLVTPHGCVCSFFPTSTMQHSFLYIFDVIATSLLSLFSEFHFELSGCLNTHCHSHAIHAIRAILCRVQASLSSLPCPQERENLPNGPFEQKYFWGTSSWKCRASLAGHHLFFIISLSITLQQNCWNENL